jgi:hypothetical protein
MVCLSHTDKIMQTRNELGNASITVHPLLAHLQYIIMNRDVTTVHETCIFINADERIKVANLDRAGEKEGTV